MLSIDNVIASKAALYSLSVPVFFFIYLLVIRLRTNARINRLGGRAGRVKGSMPLDIDLAARLINAGRARRDLSYWTWVLGHAKGTSDTVEHPLFTKRFVFTSDVDNIKAILATQFNDFGKGPDFHREWKDFLGDSIFTTDGDMWQHSRHLIRPQFVKNRITDLEVLEKHVIKLMALIHGSGETVDIADLFYRFTMDTSMDFLTAYDINSLEHPEAKFAQAFSDVQHTQNIISKMGPLQRFHPRAAFNANIQLMDSFLDPMIDLALRLDPAELKTTEDQSFLHALAATGIRDRKFIRDQITAVLLAGRDTTANTLSFLFYELARHPDVVGKLRREILNTVGSDGAPTYDDLKNMRYLQYCLNETLRLYPAVPFNVRRANKDTTLPHGGGPDGSSPVGLLEGTPVIYSTLYMQRRPDLFAAQTTPQGQGPDEFSPDRWETWSPKPWEFIPFNGGPRICVGQQFAITEMGYTVVRLLQRFERLDARDQDEERQLKAEGRSPYKCEVVMGPDRGVKVGLWAAEK